MNFFLGQMWISLVALLMAIFQASALMHTPPPSDSLMQNNEIHEILIKLNLLTNSTVKPHPQHTCRRIKYRTDIAKDYKDCDTKMVSQAFCGGQCSSMVYPKTNMVHSSCSMCTVTKKRIRIVTLYCRTGIRRVKVPIAEECGCTTCKVASNNVPQPPWRTRSKRQQRNYNLQKQKKIIRIRLRELEKQTDLKVHQLEELKKKLRRKLRRKSKIKNKNKAKKKKNKKKKQKRKKSRKRVDEINGSRNERKLKNRDRKKKEKQQQKKTEKRVFTFRDMARVLFPFSNYNKKM